MFGLPPLPRKLEACVRDLGLKKTDVRRSAIRDLAKIADGNEDTRKQAISLLSKSLTNDDEPSVRADAATALADLRANECLPALLVAVEDAHPIVGQMALAALGEINDCRALPRIERAAKDDRPELRYQAAIARAQMLEGEALLDALVAAIEDSDPNVRYIGLRLTEERIVKKDVRAAVVDASSTIGKSIRKAAIAKEPALSVASAILLGRLGDRSVIPELLAAARKDRAIAKEDEEAVYETLGALRVMEAKSLLETRAWGIRSMFEEGPALAARVGLARLGDARAIKSIEEDVASPKLNKKTRGAVAAGRARLKQLREKIENAGLDPALVNDIFEEMNREDG